MIFTDDIRGDNPVVLRADSLAYLAQQADPLIAHPDLPNHLDLIHTTVAPPPFNHSEPILNGAPHPVHPDQRIPGVIENAMVLDAQPQLRVVRSKEDLEAAYFSEEGQTAVVMGLHEPPSDASPEVLHRLMENGVRVMTLANGKENNFGSGFHNREIGLKPAGEVLLEDMTEAGMILDLSHASHQTAMDALTYIDEHQLEIAVMASHGGVYEAYDEVRDVNNARNLPAEVISGIAEMGGVVGVYALTFGLSSKGETIEPFLVHMDAMVAAAGTEHVTIGTDGVYQMRNLEEWQQHFNMMAAMLGKEGVLEPRHPDVPLSLNGLEKIGRLGQLMLAGGYSAEDVIAVSGNNLGRFFERSL